MKLKLRWASDSSDYKGRKKWFENELENGLDLTETQRFEEIIINIESMPNLMNFIREQGGRVIINEASNEIVIYDFYQE